MKVQEELVHLQDNQTFLIREFLDFTLDQPMHQHTNFYELTITQGASGTRIIGDKTTAFSELDVVLMSPGLPHCWSDYGVKTNKGYQRLVVIHFSEQFIHPAQLNMLHFHNVCRALDHSKYGLELKGKSQELALEMVQSIQPGNTLDNYSQILKILDLFGQGNDAFKICSEGYNPTNVQGNDSKIEKAYAFIQSNYTRKMSIEEVASSVNMSPSAFSHFFKKWTYKSFTDFVFEFRLGRAARLLQFTDHSISRVAYESGFQNISYFNRSFQKKFKETPLKYRKKLTQ